ncbi:hypothetical protein LTR84_007155 [Exophiala bonariae]|uniref:Uncharacterized protein n=1 Tax=Exophiala bonariae TaxID=1690606 RepID=A0AAV9N2C4_9EURO|nr:hypothetical protein LTR84_007155 [Exophiala bonariae]
MPPVLHHPTLGRREETQSKIFPIVFAVVALLVVFGCILWAVHRSKMQKKANRSRSVSERTTSSSRVNDGFHFPSHPALLRGFIKKPWPTVTHYDPRTETPFPTVGPSQDNPLPFTTPRSSLTPTSQPGSSHGLFTPAKAAALPHQIITLKQDKTVKSQAQATGTNEVEMTRYGAGHGYDYDHEYILPVPEPLVLKPRPAGRPPPLTRQLERFPVPIGTLKRNDLLHPVKLFQEIESRASQSTVETVGTPCPTPFLARHGTLSREAMGANHGNGHAKITFYERSRAFSDTGIADEMPAKKMQFNNKNEGNHFVVNVREESRKLERTGTVTKPRTPVAELRERFDMSSTIPANGRTCAKEKDTPSVNPFDTPGDRSTPPTSPARPESPNLSLDTPVPDHNPFADAQVEDSKNSGLCQATSSTTSLLGEQRAIQNNMSTVSNDTESFSKSLIPARLNLTGSSNRNKAETVLKGHSMSSLSTILRPILAPRIHQSYPVSSVYSRDTRGMSLLPTPTNDRFSQHHAVQPSSMIDARNIMSVENVQSKIDQWDLHTTDLEILVSRATKPKRTLSDYGTRCPMFRDCASSALTQPLRIRQPADENTVNPTYQVPTTCNESNMLKQDPNDLGAKKRDHAHHFGASEQTKEDLSCESTQGEGLRGVAWL